MLSLSSCDRPFFRTRMTTCCCSLSLAGPAEVVTATVLGAAFTCVAAALRVPPVSLPRIPHVTIPAYTCGHRNQQILVMRNRRLGADSSFAVCSPQCHTGHSVVVRAILIPAVCRAWVWPRSGRDRITVFCRVLCLARPLLACSLKNAMGVRLHLVPLHARSNLSGEESKLMAMPQKNLMSFRSRGSTLIRKRPGQNLHELAHCPITSYYSLRIPLSCLFVG